MKERAPELEYFHTPVQESYCTKELSTGSKPLSKDLTVWTIDRKVTAAGN